MAVVRSREEMHRERQNSYRRGRIKMLILLVAIVSLQCKISSATQVSKVAEANETGHQLVSAHRAETDEAEGGLYGQFGRRLSSDLTFQVQGLSQTTTQAADREATAKTAPVLRPSLEEVASKLSRKHLNLEHENWRLKVAPNQNNDNLLSVNEAEQEIERPKVALDDHQELPEPSQQATSEAPQNDSSSLASSTTVSATSAPLDTFYKRPLTSSSPQPQAQQQEQYFQIDTIAPSPPPPPKSSALSAASRRKKSGSGAGPPHLAEQVGDNNELHQCHQYLRRHTSVAWPEVAPPGPPRLQANQLLPCSCEWRKLFAADGGDSAVWLSCDNVQLVGSHFYAGNDDAQTGANASSFKLARFSQRDAGLQTLHSQKFHYLRLAHLRSIDLSRNRIRLIKMDAFHGLEAKLEHLNLANNLLGDSRATSTLEERGAKLEEKLIFLSDELLRLRKLRWLSLQNNQISQLGPGIFIKPNVNRQPAPKDSPIEGLSELTHLDLSLNLLQLVPSESIGQLGQLETLKLNGNRIVRLDGETKFPSSLRYLDLSENLIRSVRQCNLVDLSQLVEINLSHNQLSQLHKSAFLPASAHLNLLVPGSRRKRRQASSDLDTDESILSSLSDLVAGRAQQVEAAAAPPVEFNATLRLNLSYNYFEQIPGDLLLKFGRLQQLDLSHNRLRLLDPNYLCSIYNLVENLRQLDLSGNLMSIGASNSTQPHLNKLFGCLQRLEKLNLSTNRLTRQLAPHGRLETRRQVEPDDEEDLEAESSSIVANGTEPSGGEPEEGRLIIKFGENQPLNTLDLSDNQLKWVPIFELNKVSASSQEVCVFEVLNLNYNYLERLEEQDFGNQLRNLRQLHLDHNKLATLPVGLMRRFTSLDQLSVCNNQISSLEPLNELLEGSLRTLRLLNLANNKLMEWPQIHRRFLMVDSGVNQQQQQQQQQQQDEFGFVLEELNLGGNLLTSANITGLFDQLVYMRHLRVLNLNYNLLTRIKSEWFKFANRNLRRLLLTGNRINNIELGAFAGNQVNQLNQLSLDYNLLKELKRKTFDSMPRIRELDLSHNLIHTINSETFHQVNSLQVLRLNNNKLSSWKCEYFSHLCHSISGSINADLSALNQQESAEAELAPASVSSLTELDLSYNSLSQLRANSISVHTKLTRLNLSHNKLSFIPHDLFKATTSAPLTGRQIQLVSSLRHLSLAHNRIQTIDNINFRPLRNLYSLNLGHNELQTLGIDVVAKSQVQQERRIAVANNLTNLLTNDDLEPPNEAKKRRGRSLKLASNWPALGRLRHLNLANNQLTLVNQSLLSELSPFSLLNLNLSSNYLDSDSLPHAFYAKISNAQESSYDLIFTLKLESLDLSRNRLNEFPTHLLDNHYTSMESLDLSFNRIQSVPFNSNLMIQIKSLNLEFNPLDRQSNELVLFEQRSVRHLNLAATRLFAIQQITASPYAKEYLTRKQQLANNQTSQLDLIRSISRPINAPYLRHLNLSSNQLVWLAANVFERLHSLETLDLSNNQLTRLHLLNNQLLRVSGSLSRLNLASNLYTNLDLNDFSQLVNLRHLDLSNLPSLQRLDCRFLAKLNALKSLKMLNYPQLRQTIQNHILSLMNGNSSSSSSINERLRRKMRNELLVATMGRHCFMDSSDSTNQQAKWFNLDELELELFNDFSKLDSTVNSVSSSFGLDRQLSQLLGPKLRSFTLIGLNLTSLSDESLFGLLGDELRLKISFTSMARLPLRQLLAALAKRTKLELDFRHNNIQSVEASSLQLLDELQLRGDAGEQLSSLKLASNPIRCDCHTRPLWLWLNRRLSGSVNDSSDETGINWLRYKSLGQASDLRCHSPLKLRNKLTQHVYYNDLVCRASIQQQHSTRRKTAMQTYYLNSDETQVEEEGEEEEEEEDYEYPGEQVVVTRFNRYRRLPANYSLVHVHAEPQEPLAAAEASTAAHEERARTLEEPIKSRRHIRPPPPPLNTFHSAFHHLAGSGRGYLASGSRQQHPASLWLTEMDVMILTVISVAMTLLTFVIIAICLFKYKMDQETADEERMIGGEGQLAFVKGGGGGGGGGSLLAGGQKEPAKRERAKRAPPVVTFAGSPVKGRSATKVKKCGSIRLAAQKLQQRGQLLVPMVLEETGLLKQPASAENFLLRSPTVRRMTHNATDWFRFTLRTCPASLLAPSQLTTSELGPREPEAEESLRDPRGAANRQLRTFGKAPEASQLPSRHVEGRFAYQSDSRLESPGPAAAATGAAPNQEEQEEESHNEEASGSSSPAAYGFGCSSPSLASTMATAAAASNNNNHHHHHHDTNVTISRL